MRPDTHNLIRVAWQLSRLELLVMLRTGAFWCAAVVNVLVAVAFVLLWGEGVPGLEGSVFEQAIVVETAVLGLLLPWAAARCSGHDELRSLVFLARAAALRPAVLMIAKMVALGAGLAMLVVLVVPVMLVAQRIAAVSLPQPALLVQALSICGFVAVTTAAGMLTGADRIARWLTVTCVTALVIQVLPAGVLSWLALAAIAAVGAAVVASRADATLRFLPNAADV